MALVVGLALLAAVNGQPARAATCGDYPNQAAAQQARDTRGRRWRRDVLRVAAVPVLDGQERIGLSRRQADLGDGGGTNPSGCVPPRGVQNITFSATKYLLHRRWSGQLVGLVVLRGRPAAGGRKPPQAAPASGSGW